jgi:hypothetical protein
MDVRNLKIAARMLYENNVMQLDNKNVKINVWFYSNLNFFLYLIRL